MHTLYFVPGLGADERLFSKLKLDGFEKRCIKWIPPLKNESLPGYAERLSAQINADESFSLIGVSFGGMIAVEMSKFLNPKHLILISSAKTCYEIPGSMKLFRYLPVYNVFSDSFIRWISGFSNKRFGIFKNEEKKLFADMMLSCPADYFQSAIRMILHWKNKNIPEPILHIHGENDSIFPIKKINNPAAVKGGTHFMPYHNSQEAEKLILQELKK